MPFVPGETWGTFKSGVRGPSGTGVHQNLNVCKPGGAHVSENVHL